MIVTNMAVIMDIIMVIFVMVVLVVVVVVIMVVIVIVVGGPNLCKQVTRYHVRVWLLL